MFPVALCRTSRLLAIVSMPADGSDGQRCEGSGLASPTQLCLRSINVQWPFAQLILAGVKTIELRKYSMDALCFGSVYVEAGEKLWLVETPGASCKQAGQAWVGPAPVSVKPKQAHIVGVIEFGSSFEYRSEKELREHEELHRVRFGSKLLPADHGRLFGWPVARARRLLHPIRVTNRPQDVFGFRKPRGFAARMDDAQDSVRGNASASSGAL